MRQASDEAKKEHILTCLHLTFQEVVVPELPIIETWEDMKQLLIDKFGGDLSLEVKNDAFMHIAFKPKETLAEFADRFYMEGQKLITRRQLTAHEAYMACAQAEKTGAPCGYPQPPNKEMGAHCGYPQPPNKVISWF
ncbi:hypothetical protein DSO57_1021708 [Entomophthora muscae]|uniref:Uncharacterized protein n=1 Tax=Entomophthora muscae TaxID=34485 RepID=A0ACC2TEH6_9FUNG|nr:hypothetical protein DSO57_1021708 [Entomophthora muscae]